MTVRPLYICDICPLCFDFSFIFISLQLFLLLSKLHQKNPILLSVQLLQDFVKLIRKQTSICDLTLRIPEKQSAILLRIDEQYYFK